MEKSKKLTKRERLFCRLYCATGNAREAAHRSGFTQNPEEKGLELLSDERVISEIKKGMERERELAKIKALKGLERIAFGSISDAVRLVCSDSPPLLSLEGLDLFLISEIKKPKDGAMEIKFFDRLKALERLMQDGEQASPSALPLYNALCEASRTIGGDEDGV
ncbi:MAG: terminase small subunit [Acutalibacteraceae bacterium]